MGETAKLWRSFSRGMIRDTPRNLLPNNAAFDILDYIPDMGAPLVKRGGWTYESPNLSTLKAGSSRATACLYAPFVNGNRLLVWDEDGNMFSVADRDNASYVDTTITPKYPGVFYKNLAIYGDTTATKKYSGTGTSADLGGTPPHGNYFAVYKDRVIIAGEPANPKTVYFSDVASPETWQTADSFVTVSMPVTGLASLRNAVIVFGAGRVERLRGNSPPPGGDMILEGLFDYGCLDDKSIGYYGDYVIWASDRGVVLTDAAVAVDLTYVGGMSRYWRDVIMDGYDINTHKFAGGVLHDHYFVMVTVNDVFKDCLVCNLNRRTWFRMGNMPGCMVARSESIQEDLFFSNCENPRICGLSDVFVPTQAGQNDADGKMIQPVLETGYLIQDGLISLKNTYILYDTRDQGQTPIINVEMVTSPENEVYEYLTTLKPTRRIERRRIPIARRTDGVAFKLEQENSSQVTYFYGVDIEAHPLEKSRID